MKKSLFTLLLSVLLLLSACGQSEPAPTAAAGNGALTVVATTYPVYLFTTAITEGVEGVQVSLLVNQQTSCLHDYTLTVSDMKAIEGADVIVINGAGLEDFMTDALSSSTAEQVIDCSKDIELLPARGHEGHDHETEYDPHIWMDPDNALQMLRNIASGLSGVDQTNEAAYEANFQAAQEELRGTAATAAQGLATWATAHSSLTSVTQNLDLITFHDGFQYFARAFDLTILKSIEEEEGSEASAADVKEIVSLIKQYSLPAIYTEVNGSTSTAEAISRETGCAVYPLNMIMSGDGTGLQPYLEAMKQNLQVIAYGAEALE